MLCCVNQFVGIFLHVMDGAMLCQYKLLQFKPCNGVNWAMVLYKLAFQFLLWMVL